VAVVRELVTLLAYKVDEAGLKQYEVGFARIKQMALGLAGAMGLAFSAEKIYEFVDGLIESGNEINKIRAQITNIARSGDDVNDVMERTFEIAQETRQSYTDVLDTYKELLNVSSEMNISQDQLLSSTENIYKALRIDRATTEQAQALFSTINRIFALGSARPMTIGRVERLSPTLYRMLQDYFIAEGKGGDLRALAKAHKITTEVLVKALQQITPERQRQFEEVPTKLGAAFVYAYSAMSKAMAKFLEITAVSQKLGGIIVWLTDKTKEWLTYWISSLGGLKNTLDILGTILAAVLGPWLIAQLTLATYWMLRWAAATFAANLPWLLLAAAIGAVGLAISDIVYWIQGKGSVIGSFVGPFSKLKESFEQLDLFAGFRVFEDLFHGDWAKLGKDIYLAFTDPKAIIAEVSALVIGISAAFQIWRTLQFLGLVGSIQKVQGAVEGVNTALAATKESLLLIQKIPMVNRVLFLTEQLANIYQSMHDPANSSLVIPDITKEPEAKPWGVFSKDFWTSLRDMLTIGGGKDEFGQPLPLVTPGAVATPTPGAGNTTVNAPTIVESNITVNGNLDNLTTDQLQAKISDVLKRTGDTIANTIVTSTPRTESATH
jgi:hypothetical protein